MHSIDAEAVRQELINQLQQDQSAEQETRPTEAKFANRTIKHIANTDNVSLNVFLAQKGSPSDLQAICKQLLDRDISPSETNNPKLLAKTIIEKRKAKKTASDTGSHSSGYSSAPSSPGWSSAPTSPRTDPLSEKDSPSECPEQLTADNQLEWNRLLCRMAMDNINASDNLDGMKFIASDQTTDRGRKKEVISNAIFNAEKRTLKKPTLDLPFGQSRAIGDAAVTPIFLRAEGVRNAASHVSALRIKSPYREQYVPLEK